MLVIHILNYIKFYARGVIPLSKELEYFKEYMKKLSAFAGQDKAMETIRESLYMVSVGTDDFLENYYFVPGRSIQFTNILYGLGARKILLSGIPPAGCLPIARTVNNFVERTCKEDANEACKDFNDKLQNLVRNLNKELGGIILIYVDIYYHVSSILFTILNYTPTGTYEFASLCRAGRCIPLSKELEYFKDYQDKLIAFVGQDKVIETIRESLYMVSVGTNDFLENYYFVPGRSIQFMVDEYTNFLIGIAKTFLTDLYGLGARKILLSGIPPGGCLP
ncbi:hypothetical protein C5167_025066 [Papaver somniferum]|uniref:GDSL esterase/lipase n=1 Tax=Papaver somniferum TaxID=3469 RepID=A0A4Y7JTM5_PAPSO|nr:hypothetical protein C5167_025066 [Papaver somniferum]